MIFRLILLITAFLLASCSPAIQPSVNEAPPEMESTAYLIVNDVLANTLGSSAEGAGPFQHENLHILRSESKPLSSDAQADDIIGLWCVGVGYDIAATSGEDEDLWRAAELIVLVFEQAGQGFGGGEWQPDTSSLDLGSIEEYNQYAFDDCLVLN